MMIDGALPTAPGSPFAADREAIYWRRVERQETLEAIAQAYETHRSTILRVIRQVESRRELDPIYDELMSAGPPDVSVEECVPVLHDLLVRGTELAATVGAGVALVIRSHRVVMTCRHLVVHRLILSRWITPVRQSRRIMRYAVPDSRRSGLRDVLSPPAAAALPIDMTDFEALIWDMLREANGNIVELDRLLADLSESRIRLSGRNSAKTLLHRLRKKLVGLPWAIQTVQGLRLIPTENEDE